jgi:predicted dinucleotide-binding enzyme
MGYMKIAIVGTGNIGGTLGRKWAAAGHEVTLGSRHPESSDVKDLLDAMDGQAAAASVADAVSAGEIVLLAIPWGAVAEVVEANADRLAGKLIIDATNNFSGSVINNVDAINVRVATARVFRAFNSLGWENFANPEFDGVQADLFYCGPAGDDAQRVEALIGDVGLRPVRVGDLDTVHLVDNLGSLWVQLAFTQGMGRRVALKLLEE